MSDSGNAIRVLPNGPFEVQGEVFVKRGDGALVSEDQTVYLCRCGASKNKPFCDGSHSEAGFGDPGLIVGGRLVGQSTDGALHITLAKNGPLILDGPVSIEPTEGEPSTGSKGALCRCGLSSTKPFCDGSHKPAGFVAD